MEKYHLTRFIKEQQGDFATALEEIRAGRKSSHWMWYIFPQLRGLGKSSIAEYYGISGIEEAKAYMAEPYLKENLIKISQALLELETNNPSAVMGFPDDMKLRSCMTLFEAAAPEVPVTYGGITYQNSEAAFQAKKVLSDEEKRLPLFGK